MERIKEAVLRARAKRAEQETMSGEASSIEGHSEGSRPPAIVPPQSIDGDGTSAASSEHTPSSRTEQAIPKVGEEMNALATPQESGSYAVTPVSSIKYKQTRVVHLDPQHLEKNRIISYSKSDARTVSFDRLRTQVLRTMRDFGWRTLAVTSPTAACGKTTVALNLALSIAHQTEQTLVLADFDLRDPQMADYLGLPESPSLVDYLNGDVTLADVFVNPGIPRLTLLPNHKPILNAAETLMTKKMSDLVADIRNRYESRMVIFDLPPLLTTDDALAFLPQVDCVLLVVANGESTKSEVKEAVSLLQNTELLGTVLNKSEEMRSLGA